jgi:hypothetical protein
MFAFGKEGFSKHSFMYLYGKVRSILYGKNGRTFLSFVLHFEYWDDKSLDKPEKICDYNRWVFHQDSINKPQEHTTEK